LPDVPLAFFSYSREDSEFALRLAGDLKAAGAGVWLDQLDIDPGQEWDSAIEDALNKCPRMLLILSPDSAKSRNVRNEITRALDEKKNIIPVFFRDCTVPLQLARVQFIDFRADYPRGLKGLLKALGVVQAPQPVAPVPAPIERPPEVAANEERKRAAEQAMLEEERKQAAERARLEEERRLAAEQARLEEERRQAAGEKARLEQQERERQAAERSRLEQQERERLEQERGRAITPEPPISPTGLPAWMKMAAGGVGVVIVALVLYFAVRPKPPEPLIQKPEVKTEPYNQPGGEKTATGNVEHPRVGKRPPEPTSQPSTEWVNQFLTAWEGPSVASLRPYFDDTVSPYFSFPTATWADIAKDKQYYFERFPTLHYTLVGQPTFTMQQEGQGILEYTSSYSGVRKDGKAVDGTEHVVLNVRSVDGRWKITGMKGRNLHQ
jgi:TIR domain